MGGEGGGGFRAGGARSRGLGAGRPVGGGVAARLMKGRPVVLTSELRAGLHEGGVRTGGRIRFSASQWAPGTFIPVL
ncbi:hypothetical protein GCM10008959_14930 [Deinococcus seoulensis]|uniref:Uncharacterized protein n=1 Tax=Deinococcus seoulensis TaxID=1837379 RepID=A0ABQ2RTW5_9DEIO|nr:hypothetical protein GCM10008959_14930 [Deinococcus seoulensis]